MPPVNESALAVSSRGGLAQMGSKIAQTWTLWRAASSGEDWTLWQQARNGHSPSAVAVVRRLTPQAYGLAMQLLRRNEDAQDVVQESFLRLWNSRASEAAGAQLSTFFNTIVINRCKSHLIRRYELSAEPDALVEMADARQEVGHVSDVESEAWSPAQLHAALSRLPARQRIALAMWAYADADVREIARTLEVEVNAAHQLLYRAKVNLRAVLKGSN